MTSFIQKQKQKGFTIIEVLIVLAIAGLIISIVFLAVPQLQRNARDSKRQNIANRLSTELGAYAANNQGTYPFRGLDGSYKDCSTSDTGGQSCYDWYNRYINGNIDVTDPKTGSPTRIFYTNNFNGSGWSLGTAAIIVGTTCAGDRPSTGASTGATATSKQFALVIALERTNTYYCVDNG